MTITDRLAEVRQNIERAGRDPRSVTVVAVTKGFGPDAVAEAVAEGLAVGENYAQEMLAKAAEVEAVWHFLGSIQRNKVKSLAPLVSLWHGLSRVEEAEAIARTRPGARVLVQVDVTGQPGRGGCALGDAESVVAGAAAAGVEVCGLMTVAPPGEPEPAFRLVAAEARALGLPELSMGMTGDYVAAVAAGATIIRLGTALFGPRPRAPEVRR